MSIFKTVWGLYYTSADRSWGDSEFFNTYEMALNAVYASFNGTWRIDMQTYELEEDSRHDCGDEE